MRFADDPGVITFEVTTLGRTGRIGTKTVTDRCPLNHPTRVPASPGGELGVSSLPLCKSTGARQFLFRTLDRG
jgi:hypothetical protein